MKRQVIFLLVILAAGSIHITAQDDIDQIGSQIDSVKHNTANTGTPSEDVAPDAWSFNTMVGTSFGYAPFYASAMNMFASPQASYRANERLSFHSGLVVSQTIPVLMNPSEELIIPAGISNISAFASVSYRLAENLTLHGTGVKSMAKFPLDENRSSLDYHELSIGTTYNFGNFSIGASFHKSDNSYFKSPYGYGNSIFGPSFRNGTGGFGSPFYR